MADQATGKMTPSEWRKATDELIALTLKAQEHLKPPKPGISASVSRK